MNKTKKGYTLVELMLASSLLIFLFFVFSNVVVNGGTVLSSTENSYATQSDIRTAAQIATNAVRNSVAIFVLPQSTFSDASKRTAGWDYLGVEPVFDSGGLQNGSAIVHYVYNYESETNPSVPKHTKKVLLEGQKNNILTMRFDKKESYEINQLLKFTIDSYSAKSDLTTPSQTVTSEINALNTVQIIDWSTATDVGAAIAFRRDDRPLPTRKSEANVALVLDLSGSMKDATAPPKDYTPKITYLKEAYDVLIKELQAHPNINLSLIVYGNTAHYVFDYKKYNDSIKLGKAIATTDCDQMIGCLPVKDNIERFTKYFGTMERMPYDLNGQTNGGDGLRMGYYALRTKSIEDAKRYATTNNYLIFMTDGATNAYTGVKTNPAEMYFGNYKYNKIWLDYEPGALCTDVTEGSTTTQCNEYARRLYNEYYKNVGAGIDIPNFKTFLVGFSSSDPYVERSLRVYKDIFEVEDKNFQMANNGADFVDVFKTMAEDILSDTWHLTGPEL